MVSTAGAIIITVVVVAVVVSAAWVVYTQLRARRLGLPPPSFTSYIPFLKRSSGGGGGISGLFRSFRNPRSAAGAYEEPLQGGSSRTRRGFGPLDPDEAWDSRVGYEADTYGPYGAYEEQELRTTAGGGGVDTGYSGGPVGDVGAESYDMNVPRDVERGRPGQRQGEVDRNPFDDDAEASNISLRGVSPRPIDTGADARVGGGSGDGGSPAERRSMFKENV